MRNELTLSFGTMYAFLLVLVRISGVFVFVPIPGAHAGPSLARAIAALGCTVALFSRWPVLGNLEVTPGILLAWIAAEAALGIFAGVAIGLLTEALLMGAQMLSLQAGYAYASVIDPNTQADSGILLVLAQLLGGIFFFALGLDRYVIGVLAASLDSWPPGTFTLSRSIANELIKVSANVFAVGFRIALPVTGLLIMIDVALGVLGRIHAQLQVTLLAFPVKMVFGLLLFGWVLSLFPSIIESYAKQIFTLTNGVLAH